MLCSLAEQFGRSGSLAPDKMRKRDARSTIFVFDILNPKDGALFYHWLESPLVVLGAHGASLWNMLKGAADQEWWAACTTFR